MRHHPHKISQILISTNLRLEEEEIFISFHTLQTIYSTDILVRFIVSIFWDTENPAQMSPFVCWNQILPDHHEGYTTDRTSTWGKELKITEFLIC